MRARNLSEKKRLPIVLVGGVYLDIFVSPVTLDGERNVEFGDLDTVLARPGGSAFFVGEYLWDGFTRKSYLVSRVGKGDPFSKYLARELNDRAWIRGNHLKAASHSQCGVSIHLLDKEDRPQPTFSHRGALGELYWTRILRDVQHLTRRGGVVYLSGFFRTALHVDLVRSIRALSPEVLVVIDHGRFRAGESPAAEQALLAAFRSATVDVYICTMAEIRTLARAAGVQVVAGEDERKLINRLIQEKVLPKVTVVRGDPDVGSLVAVLVIDDNLEVIEGGPDDLDPQNATGSKNSFNAGFIHALYGASGGSFSLENVMQDAVKQGLQYWGGRA